MNAGRAAAMSILMEGSPDAERFERLAGECEVLPLADGLIGDSVALRRKIDDASSHWILFLRDGERVGSDLAEEVSRETIDSPRAWGFRIATRTLYCGETLRLQRVGAGEVRLFHRRKARLLDRGKANVQGTVLRLDSTIERVLYESEESHVEALVASGRDRVAGVRRLAVWLVSMIAHGPAALSRESRRYLWVEAGWRRPRGA